MLPRPELLDDPMRFVPLYLKGAITESEFRNCSLWSLNDANVNQFLASCPADLLEMVLSEVAGLPSDEDEAGWASHCFFQISTATRAFTTAEYEQQLREVRQAFRNGARVLRAAIAQHTVPR
ncbi:hypothetical protein [Urbifossiella limnaea]|uniref:Uncharacterized protein n=1 Tax=Urbifossiella limnaea TaxID=2528023 RepID=A0A517XYF5_9BACT|nr:hypothetical protein [Urbifossiella limnaea]QDU22503.1 hypothetical protein ETAA1_44850 [Urbifossiella limnaea]